tara:strand:+ start:516 stop:890 length:375 start_codon:yes stop_codon:yes gene_type:complete
MIKFIKIFTLTIALFTFIGAPNDVEAKDCSEYQILSHKWNKCKLNLKKMGKLIPKNNTNDEENLSAEKKDDSNVVKEDGLLKKLQKKLTKREKKKTGTSLIESKTIDSINEKCQTLWSCIFKKN